MRLGGKAMFHLTYVFKLILMQGIRYPAACLVPRLWVLLRTRPLRPCIGSWLGPAETEDHLNRSIVLLCHPGHQFCRIALHAQSNKGKSQGQSRFPCRGILDCLHNLGIFQAARDQG